MAEGIRYEYATTTGPRKAWDDPDRPPEGDGWELDPSRGRPGESWDRFDYHEERYWRRPIKDDDDGEPDAEPDLEAEVELLSAALRTVRGIVSRNYPNAQDILSIIRITLGE